MEQFLKEWWAECLLGALAAGVALYYRRQCAVRRGMRALLRNQIIHEYNQCIDREWCPIYRLESIEDMYVQYHALGGNGAITDLVERIRDLPSKLPTNKEA